MKIIKFIRIYYTNILVTSSDQQDVNKTMTNISNEVNGEQQQKVVQQTTDAIKKGKN
jgi:hypothetical protein